MSELVLYTTPMTTRKLKYSTPHSRLPLSHALPGHSPSGEKPPTKRLAMGRTARVFTLAYASTVALCSGCAQWNGEEALLSAAAASPSNGVAAAKIPGLPEARLPEGAAIVEVAFINPPANMTLDETLLSAELRSLLAANGLRAGRLIAADPQQVLQGQEGEGAIRFLSETNVASDFERRRRKLSCRDHQPFSLLVRRPGVGEVSTLVHTREGVIGHSLISPQFGFILQTRQMDDGRISVRLTPEIQHGEIKQNFVASDSLAFRMDFNREKWTLDELIIESPLAEGQALVVLPSSDSFGLGKQMFVGMRADQTVEQIALVLFLQKRPVSGLGQQGAGS